MSAATAPMGRTRAVTVVSSLPRELTERCTIAGFPVEPERPTELPVRPWTLTGSVPLMDNSKCRKQRAREVGLRPSEFQPWAFLASLHHCAHPASKKRFVLGPLTARRIGGPRGPQETLAAPPEPWTAPDCKAHPHCSNVVVCPELSLHCHGDQDAAGNADGYSPKTYWGNSVVAFLSSCRGG